MQQRKRIGILGGTFDPPTLSHMEISKEALLQNAVDEVWIIPCGIRLDKITLTDPTHRLKMVDIAINEMLVENPDLKGKVIANDIEVQNKQTIPTYPLMKLLEKNHPEYDFYFLMGHDLIKGLLKWHNGEQLVQEIKFIIAGQPDVDWTQFEGFYPKSYVKIQIKENVRSTNYRAAIKESYAKNNNSYPADLGLEKGLLSQQIIQYIIDNKLIV